MHGSREITDVPKLLFVIKEAVYKLYFPLCDHFLDFQDVKVRLASCGTRFKATVDTDHPALLGSHVIIGRWGQADGQLGFTLDLAFILGHRFQRQMPPDRVDCTPHFRSNLPQTHPMLL